MSALGWAIGTMRVGMLQLLAQPGGRLLCVTTALGGTAVFWYCPQCAVLCYSVLLTVSRACVHLSLCLSVQVAHVVCVAVVVASKTQAMQNGHPSSCWHWRQLRVMPIGRRPPGSPSQHRAGTAWVSPWNTSPRLRRRSWLRGNAWSRSSSSTALAKLRPAHVHARVHGRVSFMRVFSMWPVVDVFVCLTRIAVVCMNIGCATRKHQLASRLGPRACKCAMHAATRLTAGRGLPPYPLPAPKHELHVCTCILSWPLDGTTHTGHTCMCNISMIKLWVEYHD
eukprot:m.192449 g.192449  ORF g.192449 m.192449 type:complete len:281 (+) comp18610_c0_seq37:776-1618(+)